MTSSVEQLDSLGFKGVGLSWANRIGMRIPQTCDAFGAAGHEWLGSSELIILRPSIVTDWADAWKNSGRFDSVRIKPDEFREALTTLRSQIAVQSRRNEVVAVLAQPYVNSIIAGIANVSSSQIVLQWVTDSGNEAITRGTVTGYQLRWQRDRANVACPSVDLNATAKAWPHLEAVERSLRPITGTRVMEIEWAIGIDGQFYCLQAQPAGPGLTP